MAYSEDPPTLERPAEGFPWWKEMKDTGMGPPHAREPTHIDWKQWGNTATIRVTHAGAGVIPADGFADVNAQLVNASHKVPVGWLIAFALRIAGGQPGIADFGTFQGEVNIGLGSGRFVGKVALGALLAGADPVIIQLPGGPVPAEALYIKGGVFSTAVAAGAFPRTLVYTLGAFVSPQVWP